MTTSDEKPPLTYPWAGWQERPLKCSPKAGYREKKTCLWNVGAQLESRSSGPKGRCQDSPVTLLRCLLGLGASTESVTLPVPAVPRAVPPGLAKLLRSRTPGRGWGGLGSGDCVVLAPSHSSRFFLASSPPSLSGRKASVGTARLEGVAPHPVIPARRAGRAFRPLFHSFRALPARAWWVGGGEAGKEPASPPGAIRNK